MSTNSFMGRFLYGLIAFSLVIIAAVQVASLLHPVRAACRAVM